VVKLSRLKIGRSFSASPESLVRLSLMAPSPRTPRAAAKQIVLNRSIGQILGRYYVGTDPEADGGGSGGQYLKKAGTDTVFLVDGDFRFLKTAPAQWLDKEILDSSRGCGIGVCFTGDAKPRCIPLPGRKRVKRPG
jgi:hypothetical protein